METRVCDLTTTSASRPTPSHRARERRREDICDPVSCEEAVRQLMSSTRPPELVASTCEICSAEIDCFVLTSCTHSGKWCWICQMKLMKISPELVCYMCQDSLSRVIFSRTKLSWEEAYRKATIPTPNAESKIYCFERQIDQAVRKATEFRCWIGGTACSELVFAEDRDWRHHLSAEHNKKLCEVCYTHNRDRCWPFQHRLYHPQDIPRHRNHGDDDKISHVKCPVCNHWCFDDEAFFNHWKKADYHFDCHICQKEGQTKAVYASYEALREHHKKAHFVCDVCDTILVFANYQALLRHQTIEHPSRKPVLSLQELADIAKVEMVVTETEGFTRVTRFWPKPLISISKRILSTITEAEKRNPDYRTYSQIFSTGLRGLCNQKTAAEFETMAQEFFKQSRDIEASAETLLGKLAHLVWTNFQTLFTRKQNRRMLTDTESMRPVVWKNGNLEEWSELWLKYTEMFMEKNPPRGGRSRTLDDSTMIPCEMIAYFVLQIPRKPTYAPHIEALKQSLKMVASYEKEARDSMRNIQLDTSVSSSSLAAMDDSETKPPGFEAGVDTNGYIVGPILRECVTLPINKNLPFVMAARWGLTEFLHRCWPKDAAVEDVVGLPASRVCQIYADRTKEELESCAKAGVDLMDLVSGSDIERFLALRPNYARLSRSIPRSKEGGNPPDITKYWGEATHRSTEWGKALEDYLRTVDKKTAQLLCDYCRVCEEALPTATGVIPFATNGVPEYKVADTQPPGLTTRNDIHPALPNEPMLMGYNTWTHRAVRQTSDVLAAGEEDYPSLPGAARPTGPPGLTGNQYEGVYASTHVPATSAPARDEGRQWPNPTSSFEPEQQQCHTCNHRFDPDARRCPRCKTWMTIKSSQRAENMMRATPAYPPLEGQAPAAPGRWGPGNAMDKFAALNSRSGPTKRF